MITQDVVDGFFRDTERRGASLKRDMVWGYFFNDRDRARLDKVRTILETRGYRFVGVLEPTPDDDDKSLLVLHMERVETHTRATLFARCEELAMLAASHDLESFDGFDVGNVDGSKLYR